MTSRFSLLAALVAVALLLPTTASADARASVVAPGRDAVVQSPVALEVEVTREVLDAPPGRVQVRLSADGSGAAAGSRPVDLRCLSGCDTTTAVWGGRSYDPATAAPFGGGPGCNGRWYLQVALDDGRFASGTPVVASAPASPPRDVRVAIEGRDAAVTWGRAPEPDVAGYRVERRDSGSWSPVGEVGADATRFVDGDVAEGTYEWRVVTLRPDGRVAGGPAAPCADGEPDLETTSAAARGRVTQPPPSPAPSPSSSSDPGPDQGTADGTGVGDAPVAGDGEVGSDSGEASPDGEAVATEPTTAGTAPASAEAATDEPRDERYYGEGEEVGTLEYDDVVPGDRPTAAAPQGGTWVPGGVSVTTQRDLDRTRILRPVAGGMVLLTFAFHIRRWQREQDV